MTHEPTLILEVLACLSLQDAPSPPDPRVTQQSDCERCGTQIWTGEVAARWLLEKPGRHVLCVSCVQALAEHEDCARLQINPPLIQEQ